MSMKPFNLSEDVVSTEITVTDGFFDGGKGIVFVALDLLCSFHFRQWYVSISRTR